MKGQNFASRVLSRHTFRISRKKGSNFFFFFFYHRGTLNNFNIRSDSLKLLSNMCSSLGHELRACAIQFSSKVVQTGITSRIARKPTVKRMMKFSQLIFRGESRLELKF